MFKHVSFYYSHLHFCHVLDACTWRWLRSEANGGDGESDQGQLLSTVAVTKKDAAMHGEGDEIPGVWLSDTVTVVFQVGELWELTI